MPSLFLRVENVFVKKIQVFFCVFVKEREAFRAGATLERGLACGTTLAVSVLITGN
jgi:hypothetical protein